MKCENCTKYDDCRTGSGLTWPCGAYRPKTGGGMDIENLIADLQEISQKNSISHYKRDRCAEAATALATFQAENERLRKELEYEREHANAYHEECGQWEAENTQLRADLEQVKAERDEAVECVNTVYSYILIKRKTDAVRTIEKWLRGQKED